jgi:phage baseplate assembly protein W
MPLQRVSQGFRDLSMSFQENPLNLDLIGIKDANAIARSVKNIVFTLPGEKFFNPNFGSNITSSLFENIDEFSAVTIRDEIRNSIENYESRVRLIDVIVTPQYDDYNFNVIVQYEIIGANIPPQQLEFALLPTR